MQSKLLHRWVIRLCSSVPKSWSVPVTILCLILILMNALPARGVCRDRAHRGKAVVVVIYDYANVPDATLDRSRFEATRILAIAGIKIAWIVCPATPKDMLNASEVPPLAGVVKLKLKILPRSMATRLAPQGKSLGFALLPTGGAGGDTAYVFYDRVRRLVRSAEMPVDPVLGSVMSHEIGHLLLASRDHSTKGIMRGRWDGRVMRMAIGKHLEFSPEQAERMRAEILRRHNPNSASGRADGGDTLVASQGSWGRVQTSFSIVCMIPTTVLPKSVGRWWGPVAARACPPHRAFPGQLTSGRLPTRMLLAPEQQISSR